jgi:tight adherence protein C
MDEWARYLTSSDVLVGIAVAVAVMATIITIAMPYVFDNPVERRMKAVSEERNVIRARERERLTKNSKIELRPTAKGYIQFVVDRLNLTKWVEQTEAREKLVQAGYRGQAPYITFLFFRFVTPIVTTAGAFFYLFVVSDNEYPTLARVLFSFFGGYVGMQLPMLFVKNLIEKRQTAISRAFPDALDLLLICVEAGMSIEVAFRRVADEIATQSAALAEEFVLTTAELSFLQDRRTAYDNLAYRTDVDSIKAVAMALSQAERYGTPLANSLRVMAQESRDMRMAAAEKKAAALPPKLTVPMIVFFLPCLFVVIMGPAIIKFIGSN